MDILFWNNLDLNIKVNHTVKQYYSKYLWRLVIHAEGGTLLNSKFTYVKDALEHRRAMIKAGFNVNGGWGYFRRFSNLDNVDLSLLCAVQEIKNNRSDLIRIRIEEPNIQFYAQDEDTLKTIALKIDPKYIESITYPQPDVIPLLQSGAILKHTPITYKHKVIVRDGRYSIQIKQQLLNYLESLGDTVKISKSSRDMLFRPYESTWGVFFYTHDADIVTFIQLIDPGLISNIHTLVSAPG